MTFPLRRPLERTILVVAALSGCLLPVGASAQRFRTVEAAPPSLSVARADDRPSAAGVFLASAILPGAGQYRLGAGRWVAYLGVEGWAWINYADTRSEADALERAYRDLAWSVARRVSQGRRQDREFEYYEAMSQYPASGAYDAEPGTPGIQPESDTLTYNGELWQLARAIYFPAGSDSVAPSDEELAAALAFYEGRAIEPQYAWSWGSNQLEQEHFRSLIRRSDEAARAGTTILGVILVNHVVSAIDALISARLRGPDGEPDLRLRGEANIGRYGLTHFLVIEIPTP